MMKNKSVLSKVIYPFLYLGYIIILCFGLLYYIFYLFGCVITRSQNKYGGIIGFSEKVKDLVFSSNPADPSFEHQQRKRIKQKRKELDNENLNTRTIEQDKTKPVRVKKVREPKVKKPRQKSYFFRRNLALMSIFFLNKKTRIERRETIMEKYPKKVKAIVPSSTGSKIGYAKNRMAAKTNAPSGIKNKQLLRVSMAVMGVACIVFVGVIAYTQGFTAGKSLLNPEPKEVLFQEVVTSSSNATDVSEVPSQVSLDASTSAEPAETDSSSGETTISQVTESSISDTTDASNETNQTASGNGVSIITEENVIKKGDVNPEVIKIQERLMELHYMEEGTPTDTYGAKSSFAIELFQRQHELSVDGVVGEVTLSVLFSEEAESYTISRGNKGSDVIYLQERLQELGYLSSGYDANGYFDSDTSQAVKNFQKRNDLSADGIVGYYTNQQIYSSSAVKGRSSDIADSGSGSSGSGSSNSDSGSNSSESGGQTGGSYSSSMGAKIAETAQSYLNQGIPYVWGGKNTDGFDCSGFVYYVLNKAGISTGYRTSSAWASCSYPTISSRDDLKPGDVCVFSGHVGIYIGGGKMCDSSNATMGIKITDITTSYYTRNWVCGKRVAK